MNSARQAGTEGENGASEPDPQPKSAIVLKPFSSSEYPEFQWAVSGPADRGSRRWRRLFATRIEAEQFLAEKQRVEVRVATRKRLRHFPRWPDSRIALGMVAVLILAYGADRLLRSSPPTLPSGVRLKEDFEHNPILDGWTTTDRGSDWTEREHFSGQWSIVVHGGSWSSPPLTTSPAHIYHLKFASKTNADPAPETPPSGVCDIHFFTMHGQELSPSVKLPFPSSTHWRMHEFRIPLPDAAHLPSLVNQLQMQIIFTSSGDETYIDDVTLEGADFETKSR